MKSWNTPDHHIAETEHGRLDFADGTTLVIADWEITEFAPDSDGRVYKEVTGWIANVSGDGSLDNRYVLPVEHGRAQLVGSELRGQPPLGDLHVHIDIYNPGQPYPNTWDHPGYLATTTWMDRRVDANGQPIPDNEVGATSWTHPETGTVFDLHAAYLPKGEHDRPDWTWQHYDHWSGGVPVLERFYRDAKAPDCLGFRRLLTDGEWETVETAAHAAMSSRR